MLNRRKFLILSGAGAAGLLAGWHGGVRPLVHAATDLLKGRETLNEQAAEAVPLVTEIIDAALISLVESYQENFTRSLTGESEGEFR